jgi:hypothetical protein
VTAAHVPPESMREYACRLCLSSRAMPHINQTAANMRGLRPGSGEPLDGDHIKPLQQTIRAEEHRDGEHPHSQ